MSSLYVVLGLGVLMFLLYSVNKCREYGSYPYGNTPENDPRKENMGKE